MTICTVVILQPLCTWYGSLGGGKSGGPQRHIRGTLMLQNTCMAISLRLLCYLDSILTMLGKMQQYVQHYERGAECCCIRQQASCSH